MIQDVLSVSFLLKVEVIWTCFCEYETAEEDVLSKFCSFEILLKSLLDLGSLTESADGQARVGTLAFRLLKKMQPRLQPYTGKGTVTLLISKDLQDRSSDRSVPQVRGTMNSVWSWVYLYEA